MGPAAGLALLTSPPPPASRKRPDPVAGFCLARRWRAWVDWGEAAAGKSATVVLGASLSGWERVGLGSCLACCSGLGVVGRSLARSSRGRTDQLPQTASSGL